MLRRSLRLSKGILSFPFWTYRDLGGGGSFDTASSSTLVRLIVGIIGLITGRAGRTLGGRPDILCSTRGTGWSPFIIDTDGESGIVHDHNITQWLRGLFEILFHCFFSFFFALKNKISSQFRSYHFSFRSRVTNRREIFKLIQSCGFSFFPSRPLREFSPSGLNFSRARLFDNIYFLFRLVRILGENPEEGRTAAVTQTNEVSKPL